MDCGGGAATTAAALETKVIPVAATTRARVRNAEFAIDAALERHWLLRCHLRALAHSDASPFLIATTHLLVLKFLNKKQACYDALSWPVAADKRVDGLIATARGSHAAASFPGLRLFFAGEATHKGDPQMVHGAYMSGEFLFCFGAVSQGGAGLWSLGGWHARGDEGVVRCAARCGGALGNSIRAGALLGSASGIARRSSVALKRDASPTHMARVPHPPRRARGQPHQALVAHAPPGAAEAGTRGRHAHGRLTAPHPSRFWLGQS